MAYAFYMDVAIEDSIYGRIQEKLGPQPPQGLIMHLVVKREGGLRYIDVWESEGAYKAAFERDIHPRVHQTFEEIGFQPDSHIQEQPLEIVHLWTPLVPA